MSVGVRVSTYMAVDPFNVCVCLEASLHVRGCFDLCTPLSARISAPPPVSVCVSSPVAASSGPHNPQERAVSFFTVTGSSPRRVARGLQTNSVWPESLRSSSSSSLPPTTAPAGAQTEKCLGSEDRTFILCVGMRAEAETQAC